MGDVALINTGDGVFTGREPHTSHRNQMKLVNAIAAAAVIGTSLTTAGPAEASRAILLEHGTSFSKNDGKGIMTISDEWFYACVPLSQEANPVSGPANSTLKTKLSASVISEASRLLYEAPHKQKHNGNPNLRFYCS